MTPRLLLQLGWLFHTEAERLLPDPYAWPPETRKATPEQEAEAARLLACSDAIFDRAETMLPPDAPNGTDAAFG